MGYDLYVILCIKLLHAATYIRIPTIILGMTSYSAGHYAFSDLKDTYLDIPLDRHHLLSGI